MSFFGNLYYYEGGRCGPLVNCAKTVSIAIAACLGRDWLYTSLLLHHI